ncbi:poly-gamma-glutamate biosynthesis protein PgsC/CapC [Haloarcula sp. H-GB4]|uniref:poly-gamma-glutamate biosynthesis protein PgsC/CapC n=1 Tax=Haloarcula sp. H-GB4 TaxID=3069755 RepID=UPI0027B78140|nr:poly-gamma-glutamate biosynthesis protein PgsC/CapC [Haloarcula sp. H-GB4]MDQ2072400.1 poly-gamma-glutamate biosynthesis protein PgsC/CapC [Haloarcula sp. H-GB4]
MILSGLLVITGLTLGVTATQLWDLRLSGVIVVPLFALYTLYDVSSLPVLVVSVAAAYWCLTVVSERTLLYGRRLLYTAILFGAVIPCIAVAVLASFGYYTNSIEVYAIGSILPGVAAYNLHRLEFERLVDDIVATVAAYIGLLILGSALVSETTLALLGTDATLLFSPASDVAQLRNVAVAGGSFEMVHGPIVGLSVLFLGLLVSLFVETVWNVRLYGIIALPLLALFVVARPSVLLLYAAFLLATYAIIQFIHRRTLVYGRVLLSMAAVTAVLLSVPAEMLTALPGNYLLFTALIAGIGAYNIHRLSVTELRQSTRLSAAILGVFVLLVSALTAPPPVPGGVGTVALMAGIVLIPGGLTAARLEQQRRLDKRWRPVKRDAV